MEYLKIDEKILPSKNPPRACWNWSVLHATSQPSGFHQNPTLCTCCIFNSECIVWCLVKLVIKHDKCSQATVVLLSDDCKLIHTKICCLTILSLESGMARCMLRIV